jgi:hypothetical protein
MVNYRRIWEKAKGPIPIDENGVSYDIHHIDGNRRNNCIDNLQCVSLKEHFEIHKELWETHGRRRDMAAMKFLMARMGKDASEIKGYTLTEETKEKIKNTLTGRKRPKEVVDRVAESLRGKKQSAEAIAKRALALKKAHAEMSKKQKEQISKKISEAHKGKILKEETKEKLSKINSKLSDEQVLEIDMLIKKGVKYKDISEKYYISGSQISAIKHRKTYKWLWKNKENAWI